MTAISKIVPERGFKQSLETKARKEKVLKEIGSAELEAFELWAFKAHTPMVYDNRFPFIWQCQHSTKGDLSDNLDDAIDTIIQLWKGRFSGDEIFVLEDA